MNIWVLKPGDCAGYLQMMFGSLGNQMKTCGCPFNILDIIRSESRLLFNCLWLRIGRFISKRVVGNRSWLLATVFCILTELHNVPSGSPPDFQASALVLLDTAVQFIVKTGQLKGIFGQKSFGTELGKILPLSFHAAQFPIKPKTAHTN